MRWLFLLFVLLPLADLFFLLEVGSVLGAPATIAVTVLTGLFGAWLVRHEGRRVWRGWQESLATGSPPAHGLIDGALVIAGAALLLTPGVLTDLVGLVFLLPWSRRWIAGHVRSEIDRRIAGGRWRASNASIWPGREANQPVTVETRGVELEPETTAELQRPAAQRSQERPQ